MKRDRQVDLPISLHRAKKWLRKEIAALLAELCPGSEYRSVHIFKTILLSNNEIGEIYT
jgi:hypothetical protein